MEGPARYHQIRRKPVSIHFPGFSHLTAYAAVHDYGSLGFKAVLLQNYINHCPGSPDLVLTLAGIFQSLAPGDHVTEFHDAFDVNLSRLPFEEARTLVYFVLTGQLPPEPHRRAARPRELDHITTAIPIALALLQQHTPGHAYTAKLILNAIRRRHQIT